MNIYKKIYPIIAFVFIVVSLQAQVKFKLQLLNDNKTYQVSLVPETSYRPPMNMTSTAQVTIKVPTNSFEINNLINIQPNVEWEANSSAESPSESAEYDYISFGLATNGTDYLRYEKDLELPLFTFENALECTGEVALMDNQEDPFSPPNSAQKNVGNQITIVGADGDAYTGNLVKNSIPCVSLSTDVEEIERSTVQFDLFPNPATKQISVSLDWNRSTEAATLQILDMQGKQVLLQKLDIQIGNNLQVIDISSLSTGNYLLEMSGADWKLSSEQFVKMEK